MNSEDKRYNNSYLTSKVTNETEYEMRLRIIKEKHEERLEALTAKIRVIYEDIRKDPVIISMRSDPASSAFVSQRMKEISKDHQALEREETIERLTEELSYSQTEFKKLEKELLELKHNLELTQEGFHSERQKYQNLEAENKMLRNKLMSLNKDVENSFKKKTQEFFDQRKKDSLDSISKSKEGVEALEREIWHKSGEIEELVRENEGLKDKIENLKSELGKILTEMKEKDRVISEFSQKVLKMQEELVDSRKDKDSLKEKHIDYGQQIKNIIDFEEKSHKDSIEELNATFKEKSSRFKRKILEQKKVIQYLEVELASAKEIANSSKQGLEKSLLIAQEDLKKVKEQWEKRCREIEKEHSLQVSDLHLKHQGQISDLQRHYQELLEEKIKDFQLEHSTHFSRQRALDYELKKIMDEKLSQMEKDYILISKHEAILNEETSKLRIKHLQEIRDIEENCSKDLHIRLSALKDSFSSESQQMLSKIASLEKERSDLLATNRNLDSEIQNNLDKLENFTVKIQELKSELYSSELTKKDIFTKLDEINLNNSKLKSQLDQEKQSKKQLEAELESEREKTNELQVSLRNTEKELTFKQKNENFSYQEQISVYEETLAKEQQRAKRAIQELEHYQRLCGQLEKELDEVKEVQSKDMQEYFTSSQRIKQEEQFKYEKELESHLETKRLLIQAEHKAKILNADLEASEKMVNELRLLTVKYEKEISELRKSVSQLENSLSQSEKITNRLRKELESSKEDESSVRIVNKKALKESLDRLKDGPDNS